MSPVPPQEKRQPQADPYFLAGTVFGSGLFATVVYLLGGDKTSANWIIGITLAYLLRFTFLARGKRCSKSH